MVVCWPSQMQVKMAADGLKHFSKLSGRLVKIIKAVLNPSYFYFIFTNLIALGRNFFILKILASRNLTQDLYKHDRKNLKGNSPRECMYCTLHYYSLVKIPRFVVGLKKKMWRLGFTEKPPKPTTDIRCLQKIPKGETVPGSKYTLVYDKKAFFYCL